MVAGADILASPVACRIGRRPADPRQADETRENTENGETRKPVKSARALPRAAVASTDETLKQASPPASRGGFEVVQNAPAQPGGSAMRSACETVKQPRKIKVHEGVTCFTPWWPMGGVKRLGLRAPAMPRAARMTASVHETPKHETLPASDDRAETVKRRRKALAFQVIACFTAVPREGIDETAATRVRGAGHPPGLS